jgi:hypothetical protein
MGVEECPGQADGSSLGQSEDVSRYQWSQTWLGHSLETLIASITEMVDRQRPSQSSLPGWGTLTER